VVLFLEVLSTIASFVIVVSFRRQSLSFFVGFATEGINLTGVFRTSKVGLVCDLLSTSAVERKEKKRRFFNICAVCKTVHVTQKRVKITLLSLYTMSDFR